MHRWFKSTALAVLVLASQGFGPVRADDLPGSVLIPTFWDPASLPEKPSLDGIETIRFITGETYPPFDLVLPDGTVTGFNVDLARALCEELQMRCTIQQRPWGTILPAIEAGQADAAIASIAISDTARRQVDFTSPYYRTPARFLVRRKAPVTIEGPASLRGRKVGVQNGTAHEAYLRTFFPDAVAVPYPSVNAARAALRSGAVDVVFGDAIAASVWLNGTDAADCCAFAGGPYTESRFFGAGAGIAVRKGNAQLRQALDFALGRLATKGRYAELYLKYFPQGLY